ncbi:MAG: phosphoribosyltransferase, partial [Pseudonocardiales bacterium]|nr:phosphoribosyltransferase [Pseudonocardiales bacterium]
MLRVALPNKGTLAEPASTMMREAGYRQRTDSRDLSALDEENQVEFFYLRPKDIATYVGNGDLNMGVTGHDLMDESGSPVRQMLRLGFGYSKFRFAVSESSDWKLEDLDGKKIATSYPRLVRAHLAGKRISAQIVKLDGAVEISIQLGLADAIADVVSSGRTLRQHHLKVIGDPIAESEATLIEREPRNDRRDSLDTKGEKSIFLERLRGVVYARQYLMLDYD